MKHICDDFNASKWFDEGNGSYVKMRDEQVIGRIRSVDVPNPDELWDLKCSQAGVRPKTVVAFLGGKAVRLKPSEAIYELFKYKEGA